MDDRPSRTPGTLEHIERRAREIGFDAACDPRVGALLRSLARSVGDGRILELGTGPGTSAAWILDGMTSGATLVTIDQDPDLVQIATDALGADPRVSFRVGDGSVLLGEIAPDGSFDLIFADTWPGKYWDLELALDLLAPSGTYVIDDMLPQPNWPEGHAANVAALLDALDSRANLIVTRMNWSTGVVLAARR